VASANHRVLEEIGLGKRLRVDPIQCLLLGELSRCPVRPVLMLAGARPRVNGVRDLKLRIDRRGRTFMQTSVTVLNSEKARSQLVKNFGALSVKIPARVCARAPFCLCWAAWAGFGPVLFNCFSFSFISRAKTIIEKYRKMLKL
jgi:hypothetical protein